MIDKKQAISAMNQMGNDRVPFFFFTDFLGTKTWIKPISEIQPNEIEFDFIGANNQQLNEPFTLEKRPLSRDEFESSYQYVVDQINYGNSYLVNLTFKTPIESNLSLEDIFHLSNAKYKVYFKDRFVVFSPETFVKIKNGQIFSYPMKGTIDASVPDAENVILNDPKETAEHVTIVDLIRNDLSQVAERVNVTKFRFISEIKTHEKKLLQVSSEIVGKLPNDYPSKLGSIIYKLLPAGSISGAPKPETVRIIQKAETYERGFYTGICGHFDGETLDTGVMIRFIEKEGDQLYFKSGGGITSFSDLDKEYQETIDKVYVPIH